MGLAWELGSLEVRKGGDRREGPPIDALPTSELHGLPAVLFLDVDGVLHPVPGRQGSHLFINTCMKFLKAIVAKTKAKIVLSTAWREDAEGRQEILDKFSEYDIPAYVSCTPSISKFSRAAEILAWVDKYQPLTWVAVDDLPLLEESDEMENHFVQTPEHSGLRQQSADKIVHLFLAQRNARTRRPRSRQLVI